MMLVIQLLLPTFAHVHSNRLFFGGAQADDDSFVNVPALITALQKTCRSQGCRNEAVYMGSQVLYSLLLPACPTCKFTQSRCRPTSHPVETCARIQLSIAFCALPAMPSQRDPDCTLLILPAYLYPEVRCFVRSTICCERGHGKTERSLLESCVLPAQWQQFKSVA